MSQSGTCQRGRHAICGGASCSCSCHPGTLEERRADAEKAIESFLGDLEQLIGSCGKHEGHQLSKSGRCVFCSCGARYQGSLPSAKEKADCARDFALRNSN